LTAAIGLVAVVSFVAPPASSDILGMALLFFTSWSLCLALLLSGGTGGIYRPGAAYLILFGCFHGGLLLSIGLRGPDGFTAYDISWVYAGYTSQAVHLAILGMTAFAIATQLASGATGPGAAPKSLGPIGHQCPRLVLVSMSCLSIGAVIFIVAVLNAGGLDLTSGGYLAFVQANESDGAVGYGTLLISIGAVLGVVGGGRVRVAAWAIFGAYAVVAFLIGSRGAVLFPLLTLLVLEVRQGRRIRPLWTAAGALGVLVLVGLVRQTRLTGFNQPMGALLASPFDALAEMGYSLRPTAVVVDWHSAAEPFRDGVTLIVVPLRFIEKLTGWHGGPPAFDDRLFNVEISQRIGAIGGSPVAEGYHNFGTAGVVLVLAAIGLTLGFIERAPRTPLDNALVGIVLLPLLVQVRNSFGPVPVQLALGLLLLWFVRVGIPRDAVQPVPLRTSVG
jgi:hypothetical protein